jgi:hypothetical protein
MTASTVTAPPELDARMAAKRIAFRHSRLSSSMTRNFRITRLRIALFRPDSGPFAMVAQVIRQIGAATVSMLSSICYPTAKNELLQGRYRDDPP